MMDNDKDPSGSVADTKDNRSTTTHTAQTTMSEVTKPDLRSRFNHGKRAREGDDKLADGNITEATGDRNRSYTGNNVASSGSSTTAVEPTNKRYKQSQPTRSNSQTKQGMSQNRRRSANKRSHSYTGNQRGDVVVGGELVGCQGDHQGSGGKHRMSMSNRYNPSRQNSYVGSSRGFHRHNSNKGSKHNNNLIRSNQNIDNTDKTHQNSRSRSDSGPRDQNNNQHTSDDHSSQVDNQNQSETQTQTQNSSSTTDFIDRQISNLGSEVAGQNAEKNRKRKRRRRNSKIRTNDVQSAREAVGDVPVTADTDQNTTVGAMETEEHSAIPADNPDLMQQGVESISLQPSVTVDGGTKSIDGSQKEMRFRFGNYLHYYGYRTPHEEFDPSPQTRTKTHRKQPQPRSNPLPQHR